MSLAVGVASSSKTMGFDEDKVVEEEGKTEKPEGHYTDSEIETKEGRISRRMSEASLCTTDDDDDNDDDAEANIQLGPQVTLKELAEKDKVFFI